VSQKLQQGREGCELGGREGESRARRRRASVGEGRWRAGGGGGKEGPRGRAVQGVSVTGQVTARRECAGTREADQECHCQDGEAEAQAAARVRATRTGASENAPEPSA